MAATPVPRITRAVLSAAGRRTSLDTPFLPKALLDIEGTALISHVLRQLHSGGIRHVVLVLAYHAAATVQEVRRFCRCLPGFRVEALDLGDDYDGFYAKSLLAAREQCRLAAADGEPGVLIATADHIFDEALVADVCCAPLEPGRTEVCVLVDFARTPFLGLPLTAVGVRCDGGRVAELSRALAQPAVAGGRNPPGTGVEAGLFACRSSLFDRLEALAGARDYFTLTDAVQELAADGLVASVATTGRRWVAVETEEELECATRRRTDSGVPVSCSSQDSFALAAASPDGTPQYLREPVPIFFVAGGRQPGPRWGR